MPGLIDAIRDRGLIPAALLLAMVGWCSVPTANGQTVAEIAPRGRQPIDVRADYGQQWKDDSSQVTLLRGNCRIVQGTTVLTASRMVVWQAERGAGRTRSTELTIYFEGQARLEEPGRTLTETSLVGRLQTGTQVRQQIRELNARPAPHDPLYQTAVARTSATRRQRLQQTQYIVPAPAPAGPEVRTVQLQPQTGDVRRVRIFPRSAVAFTVESFRSERTTPPEQISVLTGGINVLIDGLGQVGTVDLAADRMVIWTQATQSEQFQSNLEQSRETPFTVYLEGNIIIRQGPHLLRASHAVYDARDDRALMLNAELRTRAPQFDNDVRVRAERLRQLSRDSFHAQQAWISASRFGKPGYRLQASDIFLENRYEDPWIGPSGISPLSGQPPAGPAPVPWVTSLNNTLFIEDAPVFYLPYLSSPANEPNIPLRRISLEQDSIFGAQVKSVWNMHTLLGIDEPQNVQWDLLADFYSKRGPAIGTALEYRGNQLGDIQGPYFGEALAFYVHDDGEDNLGADRRDLPIENNDRWRVKLRHRHELPGNFTAFGEVGFLSDRNFLEQYYENEFDEQKDNETLAYLKQGEGNKAWSLLARTQLNDFENQTEWYPRGDLYVLSEPLFNGLMTWSTHSSAGYARLNQAEAPFDPADTFTPLPYFADSSGAVLMTRHELDMPFRIGPANIVPYALGEAAYWGDDLQGNSADRLVGSLGVRSSVMAWRTFPYIYSRILNVNGLAHKNLFELEFAYTDSTENLNNIPQYNEFDDNAQERFRQRMVNNTFNGALPPQFDPRFYAVRQGAGLYVTSPYHELVEDQSVARLAWRQRLQTKVGPPERLRIKDWMTLDLEGAYFPNEDRDNFGEEIGLLSADYQWNVGERTSLQANAYYDLFDNAPQLWSAGILSQRNSRGSVYLGVRQVKGAGLDSQILSASYSYRMSPKWISTVGTAYDLAEGRNAGQSLTITRVGADFLVHVGTSFDGSKNNSGVAISIEPRFGTMSGSGQSTQLSSLLAPP